jgi:hypothetical protein
VRVIHETVLDALRELADQGEQTRLWSATTGPEVSSFDECVCRLFDDNGLTDELQRGIVYAPDVDQDLRLLGQLVKRIDSRRSPASILNDPALGQVRSSAGSLLGRLQQWDRPPGSAPSSLRRFWFEFEPDAAPLGMGYGCGVTAYDRHDAEELVSAAIDGPMPTVRRVIEDVDVSTLDGGHVLPNMLPPNERGIWFPAGA